MKKIAIYTGIFLIGFVAVSFWAFYLLISPPNIEIERNGVEANIPKESITLTTEDGINLSGWFAPSKEREKAVILLHGYPAEKTDMLGIASKLHPEFSVLLLDLRSFGDSQDTYTTLGIKEQKDVTAATKFLKEKGYDKIGIYGVSLGSTASLLSANNNNHIDAVGVDTSFSDIKALGYRTYSPLWIIKYPLVETMGLWGKLIFGTSIKSAIYDSAEKLEKPILLTRLQKDRFSVEHTLKMKELLKNNKRAEFFFPEWENTEIKSLEERIKQFFLDNL